MQRIGFQFERATFKHEKLTTEKLHAVSKGGYRPEEEVRAVKHDAPMDEHPPKVEKTIRADAASEGECRHEEAHSVKQDVPMGEHTPNAEAEKRNIGRSSTVSVLNSFLLFIFSFHPGSCPVFGTRRDVHRRPARFES